MMKAGITIIYFLVMIVLLFILNYLQSSDIRSNYLIPKTDWTCEKSAWLYPEGVTNTQYYECVVYTRKLKGGA